MADVCVERTRLRASSNTCVIAPHGGEIEAHTDSQAKNVARALDCSAWLYEAHSDSQRTFKKHHVTSTKITVEDFPELSKLNYPFKRTVAFHGHSGDDILVGGYGAGRGIHGALLDELRFLDLGCAVRRVRSGNKAGRSQDNIVNRLASPEGTTIQIEQPLSVREANCEAISEAVSTVLSTDGRQERSFASISRPTRRSN